MYAGLARPIKQKFGTIWLKSTAVQWILNACVAVVLISCIWITVTILTNLEAGYAKAATLELDT